MNPCEHSVPCELLNFIRDGQKFFIAGHKEPDGDCVGSQVALSSVLRRIGKEAILCSAGPFKRSEVLPYENLFVFNPAARDNDEPQSRLILVDCSDLERTGDLEPYLKGLPFAVIDHHETSMNVGGIPCYIDCRAPSTTFLVRKLILALGLQPNQEESELLFFGLCTDTGFFRHVDIDGAGTFEEAAALIRSGANPRTAYSAIYGNKSMDSRRLLGRILIRTESHFSGKLILSTEEFEESCVFGFEGRDSESLYKLLQSVANVEAVVYIRQETPEKCTVGLRSNSWVDMGKIAATFGGGGHRKAAGFSMNGNMDDVKAILLKTFEKIFSQSSQANR